MHVFQVADYLYPTSNVENNYFSTLVPGSPMVSASAISTTTISLFWPSASTMIDSYEVMWETGDIGGSSGDSDMDSTTISASSTSYTITSVEEDSSYTIIVRPSNFLGDGEDTIIAMTLEAGESKR